MQNGLLTAHDEGVAGVVPALESPHDRCTIGQQIDNLTLAFVSPLQADDDDASAHCHVPEPITRSP